MQEQRERGTAVARLLEWAVGPRVARKWGSGRIRESPEEPRLYDLDFGSFVFYFGNGNSEHYPRCTHSVLKNLPREPRPQCQRSL